jgi:hypothetical protein
MWSEPVAGSEECPVTDAAALVGPAHRPLAATISAAALVAVGGAAVLGVAPPAARPADSPPAEFSAARAHAHVVTVAARTHVAGSVAGDRVREHLTSTLRGLGLRVEEQDTTAPEAGQLSGGAGATALARVRNVVAVLPGTAPTGRVFLVAHYDSVQVGPGANDDGAGTAAILEVARALTAGSRPRNDVVFVLTDAEEACLCGAAAFAAEHPLARDSLAREGGVVLNLEARGSTGPVIMFETSPRNAALVDVFGRAAPHPVGTSFAVEVYRLLPNDTDFTAFLDAGFAGLNSAYIDGGAVYHTPLDTPSRVDRASLQHHGDNALALAREFGRVDLRSLDAGGDATYFPVPGGLVRYPGWLTWPLAVLALLAVAGLAWLARRRGRLTGRRLAAGLGLGLLPLVLAPAAAQALWWAVSTVRPGYAELLDPYRARPFRLAVLALAAAVVLGWYALNRRRTGPAALAVAALGWLAVLGVVLAALVPGGAYLATVPALAGALAGVAALGGGRGWGAVAAVTAGAAVGALVLLPAAVLLFPALGMSMGGAAAFVAVLLGFAALPVIDLLHPPAAGLRGMAVLRARRAAAVPTTLAVLAALVLVGIGLRVDRFDAGHPVPTHLMYALDADTGTARWFSHETEPQEWTAQYVDGEADDTGTLFPLLPAGLLTGPAQAAALPAPDVTVLSDTAFGDVRTLRLTLRPRRTVRLAGLYVDAATAGVDRVTVAGRNVPVEPAGGQWSFSLVFHAPPPDGVEITLELRPPPRGGNEGRVRLRVLDGSDGLTGLPGFRARPPGVGIAGSHTSELALVARTVEL